MTEVNKKEALRWAKAGCPQVWVKNIDTYSIWHTTVKPCWDDTKYYIIDDEHAELRKLQIDYPEAEFEYYQTTSCSWITIYEPNWHIKEKYRIKPIFKIGDKLKLKNDILNNENSITYKITDITDNKYYIDNTEFYIKFIDQFKFEKVKEEYEYPIYKIFKKGTYFEYIVKFIDLTKGVIVFAKQTSLYDIGSIVNVSPHTDTSIWQDIPYDKERNLYDKQPIIYWDNNKNSTITVKYIGFYDAINKRPFYRYGKRNGASYDNYIPYPHPDDDFILEMYKRLEE